MIMQYAEPVN